MSSNRRLSQNLSVSTKKLRLDSINKILKIDTKGKKQRRESLARGVSRVALSELIKNAPTNDFQNKLPDFKVFLRDKENLKEFREFLESQYCQENLDFYLACERFRRLDAGSTGHELVKFMATQIYKDFLSQNARQPVNIDHTYIKKIEQSLPNPGPDLFEDAKFEIFKLMQTDCFPRFCRTWQLERELAERIVKKTTRDDNDAAHVTTASSITSRLTTISPHSNKERANDESRDTTIHSLATPSVRPQSISATSSSSDGCTSECPYFSISRLPCPGHRVRRHDKRSQDDYDLDQHMDLKRIHKLPDSLRPKRVPPPPPLPPRPHDRSTSSSRTLGVEARPFVGKAFNV